MFTSQIDSFVLPLPPLAEQRAIAASVDRAMAQVDGLASLAEAAATCVAPLDAAVLAAAFRGELVDRQSDDDAPVLSATL